MQNMRKKFEPAFKARVALEAAKGDKTIAQIAGEYGVHSNQIREWLQKLISALPQLFANKRDKASGERDELISELYRQIGQLKVEVDWLKKKAETLQLRRSAR